jgi:hypothetical protein
MTDLRTDHPADLHESEPAAGLPDRDERPPAEPAAALSDGVKLTRLLALVRLTAPQALEVGAGMLAEAARAEVSDAQRSDGNPVVPDQAVIGADGRVVLEPAPDRESIGRPQTPGRTGATLAAVLADVAGSARHPGRPADPVAAQLLGVLDRAVRELPDAGVPAVASLLQEAAAGIDRGVVRTELAALARAIRERSASVTGAGAAQRVSTVARAAPARRATKEETRTAVRRIGAWLLSVLLLAGVVTVEVALLRDDIAADVALLLDAGRSGSTSSSTAPEPDGLPIVPPAPAAAGSVTAVDLRPLARCAPAAPCTVRLLVRLVPAPEPQTVTWSYRIVDRCTGATATVPGGSVTVRAGGQRAATVGTVAIPDLPAVAVVAVTDLPAAAASRPVSAGSCLPARQAG